MAQTPYLDVQGLTKTFWRHKFSLKIFRSPLPRDKRSDLWHRMAQENQPCFLFSLAKKEKTAENASIATTFA